MLAKTPLRDLAISWLEQQDPNTEYNWSNACKCACGQLAKALGRFDEWMGRFSGDDHDWARLNKIACGNGHWANRSEWTFGKFLERLKASEFV